MWALQADLRFTRFPDGGSLHLRGSWRRLGLLVERVLCARCGVLFTDLIATPPYGVTPTLASGMKDHAEAEELSPRTCSAFCVSFHLEYL